MSDQSDRDRRGDDQRRRRFRRGGFSRPGGRGYHSFTTRKDSRQEYGDSSSMPSRPVILAKHNSDKPGKDAAVDDDTFSHDSSDVTGSLSERPVTVLRSRDDSFPSPASPTVDTKQAYQILRPGVTLQQTDVGVRSGATPSMSGRVKLIDDMLQWNDMSIENLLMDQTQFLVIGVLGLHGVGKSTILSLLAGNTPSDSFKSYVFPPENKDDALSGMHATLGVDMYVTPERVIFLDTQPVLSTSVLDNILHAEKKYASDFISPENSVEIQSLQLAAFLMSVCNVLLVIQDNFTDLDILNLLHTAEMVKPPTPTVNLDAMYTAAEQKDYLPHIVFLQNKSPPLCFSVDTYALMDSLLYKFFSTSNLKLTGSVSLPLSECVPGLNRRNISGNMNLFVLPWFAKEQQATGSSMNYQGHPSFDRLLSAFRSQLFSIPRYNLTHVTLTEKNWFNYAARLWDQVRKSQVIAEYNRFLP